MDIELHPPSEQKAATAKSVNAKSRLKLEKAVREFESVFVGYMLKSMKSTIPKAEREGDNFGSDMLEGMFDVELARHISNNSNLGIAEKLYRQFTGERLPKKLSVKAVCPEAVTEKAVPARITPTVESHPADVKKSPEMPKTIKERIAGLQEIIDEAAGLHGIDSTLIKAVIAAESGGKPGARSSKNAKGLMQLIDSTAADMGVANVWDPRQNVLGGARYLRELLDRFEGDEDLALASYNAGPKAVEKHGGIPPFKETQEYVRKARRYMQSFQEQE